MVRFVYGGRKPSQYGSRITLGSETKSVWLRNYRGVGNQVNMVPELPVGRKPSQYGSRITGESETKSIWSRHYLYRSRRYLFESLIIVTVGWGPTVIFGMGHQNQRGSKEGGREWRF